MSLVNPIYVTFKFDKQELEGELIPVSWWHYNDEEQKEGVISDGGYFDGNQPKNNKEEIYCRYKNIQGYIRPFDAELRKLIFNSYHKWRTEKYGMNREDIEACDALITSKLLRSLGTGRDLFGNTMYFYNASLLVSDLKVVRQKDIKSTKEEIELCRSEIVERNSRWLNSVCNGNRNLIEARKRDLHDLESGKTDIITKVYIAILYLAFLVGVDYGFMESISLGILWCIVGCFILKTNFELKPVKKRKWRRL